MDPDKLEPMEPEGGVPQEGPAPEETSAKPAAPRRRSPRHQAAAPADVDAPTPDVKGESTPSLPCAPEVFAFLCNAVQAANAAEQNGQMSPALSRQVGKAADALCGVLESQSGSADAREAITPHLLRLAALMGADPGPKRRNQKALAALLRRARRAMVEAVDG